MVKTNFFREHAGIAKCAMILEARLLVVL